MERLLVKLSVLLSLAFLATACKPATEQDMQNMLGSPAATPAATPAAVYTPPPGMGTIPDKIMIVSGNGQSGAANSNLWNPFTVKVVDVAGQPVPYVVVTFAVGLGGGAILTNPQPVLTDFTGHTTTFAKLGVLGANTFTASMASGSVPSITISANATTTSTGVPNAIMILSGNGQSGSVATALSNPLTIKVLDTAGQPAPGVSVTFAATSGGGSVSPAVIATDTSGQASTTATQGATQGTNIFTATMPSGAITSVTFSSNATPVTTGIPDKIVIFSGNSQTGVQNATLSTPLTVKVTDTANQPVANIQVTFTSATGGGTVLGSQPVLTDSTGQASAIVALGASIGTQTFIATMPSGAITSVTFSATAVNNSTGIPNTIQIVSGNGQTAVNGSQLVNPLTVKVLDTVGQPVQGINVTFTSALGTIVTTQPVVTDSTGMTQSTVNLGPGVGTQTFTATMASGATPSVVFSETSTAAATQLKIFTLAGSTPVGASVVSVGSTLNLRAVLVDSSGIFVKEIPATWWTTGTIAVPDLSITGGNPSKYSNLTPTQTAMGTVNVLVDNVTDIQQNNITSTTAVTGTLTCSLALVQDQIVKISGDAQSVAMNTASAANLVVKVVNAGNAAVPGTTVTMTANTAGDLVASVAAGIYGVNATATTDAGGLASFMAKPVNLVGLRNYTATISSGSVTQVAFSLTGTPGAAYQLAFSQQPSGANAGTAFSVQPIVSVKDFYGNVVTTDTARTITLSLDPTSGLNPPAGTLAGGLTPATSNGYASFINVSYSVGETGIRLKANAAGLLEATSASFDVGTILVAAQCNTQIGWQTIDGGCKDLTSGLVWSASTTAVGTANMSWHAAVWDSATSGSPSPEAWQVARGITKDVNGTAITDANAASYCQNLVQSGLSDWRLPTIGEWQGADQHGAYGNLKNGNLAAWQWSSTIYSASYAYVYYFIAGATGTNYSYDVPTTANATRCVRQPPPTKIIEVTPVAGGTNGLGVGVAFSTQPAVRLADNTNSTVTYTNATVTLTVTTGPGQLCIHNKTTGRLYDCAASKSVNAVSGVASFNNLAGTNTGLAVNAAGTYTLTASSPSLNSLATTNFTVNQNYPLGQCLSLGNVWVNGNGGCKDTTTGLIFSSRSPTTMNWYDAVWDSVSYTCSGADNAATDCTNRRAASASTDYGTTSDYGFIHPLNSPGISPDASSIDYCHDLQESGYTDWIMSGYGYGSDIMRSYGDYYYMNAAGKAVGTYTNLNAGNLINTYAHWTLRGDNGAGAATAIYSYTTAAWINKLSTLAYVYCMRREAPATIAIVQQPADAAGFGAGQPWQTQPILQIKDSQGHGPLSFDASTITLEVVAASDMTGGTGKLIRYSGLVPWTRTVSVEATSIAVNASNGVLDFTSTPLAYSKPGEKFRIKITASGTWQGTPYTLPIVYTNDITVPVIYAPAACTTTAGGTWESVGGGCKRLAGVQVYSHQLFNSGVNLTAQGGYYGSTYWEKLVWDSTRAGGAPGTAQDIYDLTAVDDYDVNYPPTTYFDTDSNDLCHRLILNGYRDWKMPMWRNGANNNGTYDDNLTGTLGTAIPLMSNAAYLVMPMMSGAQFYMGFYTNMAWYGWYNNMTYSSTKGYCVRTIKGGGDPFQY